MPKLRFYRPGEPRSKKSPHLLGVLVVLLAALIAGLAFWRGQAPDYEQGMIDQCRDRYRVARTLRDTASVDQYHPFWIAGKGSWGGPEPRICGEFRAKHLTDVTSRPEQRP